MSGRDDVSEVTKPVSHSIIVAAYNQPKSIALLLAGLAHQSRPIDEIIIADDGSTAATHEAIERARQTFNLPISAIVSQPDLGYRRMVAVNRAVLRSRGRQLLFLDGDIIPCRDWLYHHARAYRPMTYAVGDFLRMSCVEHAQQLYDLRTRADWMNHAEAVVTPARQRWLRKRAAKARFYAAIRKRNRPRLLAGNFSVDRGLYFGVNGFDERFVGYSAADSDLRTRMNRYGGRAVSVIRTAIGIHLHPRLDGYVRENRHNFQVSKHLLDNPGYWAELGLTGHVARS